MPIREDFPEFIILGFYLPDLVMIISVPSSWNLSHSSLVSRLQEIFAISSLGTPGLVGIRGSVHTPGALPLLKSPCASMEESSERACWLQEDFSTNCSERKIDASQKRWWRMENCNLLRLFRIRLELKKIDLCFSIFNHKIRFVLK